MPEITPYHLLPLPFITIFMRVRDTLNTRKSAKLPICYVSIHPLDRGSIAGLTLFFNSSYYMVKKFVIYFLELDIVVFHPGVDVVHFPIIQLHFTTGLRFSISCS